MLRFSVEHFFLLPGKACAVAWQILVCLSSATRPSGLFRFGNPPSFCIYQKS
jgi:hypothetical protein